jgi:hypothetical protein
MESRPRPGDHTRPRLDEHAANAPSCAAAPSHQLLLGTQRFCRNCGVNEHGSTSLELESDVFCHNKGLGIGMGGNTTVIKHQLTLQNK